MQAQTLPSFNFEGTQLRVFGDSVNPMFVAADICKALGIQNVTQAVRALAPFERAMLNIGSGKPEVNVVNESGLYTLILRSRDATKEGTPAYRFRVKVTSEILPEIRRTGRYESGHETITSEEQYAIRKAVKTRAKNCSVHYQTIYNALYDYFKIASYKDLRHDQMQAALALVNTCEIKPQLPKPEIPEGAIILEKLYAERIRSFIYCWRYLFREDLELIYKLLVMVKSPMAAHFWAAVHDMNLCLLESDLERQGYAVKDLPCYKHWISHR